MKRFFKDKKKMIIVSVFLMLFIAGCSSYIDPETGLVATDKIITLSTTWGEAFQSGWFDGIFVFPIAWLINFIAQYADAGIAIIVVTALINFLTAAGTLKQQVATQKMQMMQPELNRIQDKYKGKTDDRSRMAQANEMQALYKKYDVNPFASILTLFIQLPVILAVYQAVMRADSVVNGTFLGINLAKTPMAGVMDQEWAYLLIFLLMVGVQFISMKFPQWQAERAKKRANVKEKKYAQPENSGGMMQNSMNMMMYVSIGMISLLSINWPLGMSFYWLVSAGFRVVQTFVIDKFFISKQ
ncbi:MAG: YidC/Oxa1 family membrane protein insertase [Erysipelotrichaceae bacterium]